MLQEQRKWKLREPDLADLVQSKLPERNEPGQAAASNAKATSTSAPFVPQIRPAGDLRNLNWKAAPSAPARRSTTEASEPTGINTAAKENLQPAQKAEFSEDGSSREGAQRPGKNLDKINLDNSSSARQATASFSSTHRASNSSAEDAASPSNSRAGQAAFSSQSATSRLRPSGRAPAAAAPFRRSAAKASMPVKKLRRASAPTPSVESAGGGSSPSSAVDRTPEAVQASFEDTVKGAGKSFMASFEHNSFGRSGQSICRTPSSSACQVTLTAYTEPLSSSCWLRKYRKQQKSSI